MLLRRLKILNNCLFRYKSNKCIKSNKTKKAEEAICVKSLKFACYGKPTDVIEICEDKLNATNPNQVLVKILAAPIHPIDLDLVQGGTYAAAKKEEQGLPLTPGVECVAEIVALGSNVKELKVGQRVVVPYAERGTWTTHAAYNVDDLAPVPEELPIEATALLTVNPCTAYRILRDFVSLKNGDCVLLNGANTALGQSVHQLCKAWNIKSVGLVRERANMDEAKEFVKALGATEVMSLEELRQSRIFESGQLPKPRLTLACVARSSSKELGQYLDPNGVMVSYGSLAGQPVAAATTAYIFKDFVHRPFWMTRWNKYNPDIDERNNMIEELCTLMKSKALQPPETELVPFEQYKEAIEAVGNYKGYAAKKILLDMRCV